MQWSPVICRQSFNSQLTLLLKNRTEKEIGKMSWNKYFFFQNKIFLFSRIFVAEFSWCCCHAVQGCFSTGLLCSGSFGQHLFSSCHKSSKVWKRTKTKQMHVFIHLANTLFFFYCKSYFKVLPLNRLHLNSFSFLN